MSVKDTYRLLPFMFKSYGDQVLLTNDIGLFYRMPGEVFTSFVARNLPADTSHYLELKSRFMLSDGPLSRTIDLMANVYRTKKEYLKHFTSLHMVVITKRCNQKCSYCHASSVDEDVGATQDMSLDTVHKCIDTILKSPADVLKIEMQGGEPLLRYDLVKEAIEYSESKCQTLGKKCVYVVCTNMLCLKSDMLTFFKEHNVLLSTSLDGPRLLHDTCRKLRNGSGTYDIFKEKLCIAQQEMPKGSVSALLTVTPQSITSLRTVIDEYTAQGLNSIFLRPLNPFGRARSVTDETNYTVDDFIRYYRDAIYYIIELNKKGTFFSEYFATLLLTRILTSNSTGFVDLQSPPGTGISCAIYDVDGSIFVSDEARMLFYETGDRRFCLGTVNDSWRGIFSNNALKALERESCIESLPGCAWCVYQPYCGIDPVRNYSLYHATTPNVYQTDTCRLNMKLFEFLFELIENSDTEIQDILWSWITGKRSVVQ